MKRYAWAVGLAVLASGSPWLAPSPGRGAEIPLMTPRQLARLDFKRLWFRQLALRSGERVERAVLRDKGLYFATNRGRLIAVSADSGQTRWTNVTGTDMTGWYEPAVTEDGVFLVHGNVLMQLDRDHGSILWRYQLPFIASTAPAVTAKARYVYIGASDQQLFAIRGDESDKYVAWHYRTRGIIESRPVEMLDFVAFASTDGKLYSSAGNERNVNFSYRTDGTVTVDLVPLGKYVLVGSHDYNLYCVDVASGRRLWFFRCTTPITRRPAVVCTDVYLSSHGEGLYRLDGQSGKQIWWREDLDRFVASGVDRAYLLDSQRRLVVADLKTGQTKAVHDFTRQFKFVVENTESENLFLATPRGFVMALRSIEATAPVAWPVAHPERTLAEQTMQVVVAQMLRKAAAADEGKEVKEEEEEEEENKEKKEEEEEEEEE